MNFFSSIFKTMSKGPTPPKLFDPTAVSMRGWMKKFNEEYLKNGLGPTYNKLRMLNYFRSGTLVGTSRSTGSTSAPTHVLSCPARGLPPFSAGFAWSHSLKPR